MTEYQNIKAYRVTWRLRGLPLEECFRDLMAESLPCGGCGAPAGYFCYQGQDNVGVLITRFTCKGTERSQDPRTLQAFARAAEEIEKQAK